MKHFVRVLCVIFYLTGVGGLGAADYVLIGSPDLIVSSLSKDEVKDILLGNKSKWDSGGAIKLAILSGGAVHEKVIANFTARSPDQFDKFWKKQVFTGKGISPDAFTDESALVAFVAKNSGAFGYVSPTTPTPGVKVIAGP